MHTIQIEKQIDVKRKINPMYLEGEGRCPPEDVGGTHGFEEFLAIIQNKSNPERDSYIEWYGSVFDPYMVNFKEINKKLANLDQYITQIESNYD